MHCSRSSRGVAERINNHTVESRHGLTNLICKPKPFGATSLLLIRIVLSPAEQEYKPVNRFTAQDSIRYGNHSGTRGPYFRQAKSSSSNETTSWTLTPLTPKSRSITLKRAFTTWVRPKVMEFIDGQTGSDSSSQKPFQDFFSSSETGA